MGFGGGGVHVARARFDLFHKKLLFNEGRQRDWQIKNRTLPDVHHGLARTTRRQLNLAASRIGTKIDYKPVRQAYRVIQPQPIELVIQPQIGVVCGFRRKPPTLFG